MEPKKEWYLAFKYINGTLMETDGLWSMGDGWYIICKNPMATKKEAIDTMLREKKSFEEWKKKNPAWNLQREHKVVRVKEWSWK
jgi:hypothetical protein